MSAENEKEGWIRVHDSVRDTIGDYNSAGIEIAFNAGVPVVMPAIEGLSPKVKVRYLDQEQSIANILADPTEEEQKRWAGMTEEEIRQDVENYVRKYAEERGVKLKESSGNQVG